MISVQVIRDIILSRLDADGSDRYTFDQDIKPAINSSIDWLVAVFNKAFADKKLSEENLQELIKVIVYQTNSFSRINFNPSDLGFSVWTLLKVNPEPTVYPTNSTITTPSADYQSIFRSDISYVKSKYSAKRLTTEQWEDKTENIFEAGNQTLNNTFKSYAYLNYANYGSTNYLVSGPEIEISPEIPVQFVGVTLLKYPSRVNSLTDNVQFPETLTNLVIEKALNFISNKQGDQTNLYAVTAREVQTLVQLMV